jgi:hypothetical protein
LDGCNVPTLPDGPCGSAASCQDYACDRLDGCHVSLPTVPTVDKCPAPKQGVIVNGKQACVAVPPPPPPPPPPTLPCTSVPECEALLPGEGLCAGDVANCVLDKGCDVAIGACEIVLACVAYAAGCLPEASPPEAGAPDPGNPPDPSYCTDAASWDTVTKIAESTVWTPTLIIHSPYRGSSEVMGGWTKSSGVFINGGGHSSTIISQERQDTVNGETKGLFRVAKWGYYKYVHNSGCGAAYTSHYAMIMDDEPNGFAEHKSFSLWGNDKTTDRDDWETVSGCYGGTNRCYNSLQFGNRYANREATWDTQEGAIHPLVGTRTYSSISGEIGFSGGWGSASLSLAVSFVADETSEVYYQYNMPQWGVWSGDYLGARGRSALAFCDDWNNGHC